MSINKIHIKIEKNNEYNEEKFEDKNNIQIWKGTHQ